MIRRTGVPLMAAAIVLLLALGACSGPVPNSVNMVQPAADISAAGGYRASTGFAVAHRFTLLAPNSEIEALQQKHMAECRKLGCSIASTSINRPEAGGVITARASVRLKPDSYEAFAAVLAAPPARVTFHSETSDDLVVPTLDAEKRLAAKTALRERLTALLNDQNTKAAADLIAIERELSQAQGEIETMTAQLGNLHQRTDTVSVDITYTGEVIGSYGIDLTPIRQATNAIAQTVVRSLSALIYCLAFVAPWLPVIAIVLWLIRRSLRRRQSA